MTWAEHVCSCGHELDGRHWEGCPRYTKPEPSPFMPCAWCGRSAGHAADCASITGKFDVPLRAVTAQDTTNPKDRLGLAKVPLRLVPSALMIWAAMAFKDGAKKYGAYNWRGKAVRYTVYTEAAQRHILQAFDGEDVDPVSKCKHLGHAIACLGIILDAEATGNLVDDRPPAGSASRLIEQLTETKTH